MSMRIGEVAARAGVTVQTMRYYERRALLPEPKRGTSGYREYGPEAVRLVRFIKRAQELGFTLRDVGELISLRNARARGRAEVRSLVLAKLGDIAGRVRRLTAMQRALEELQTACTCKGVARNCPIIEALDDESV